MKRFFSVLELGAEQSQNWYNEVNLYDFNSQGFSGETGHFTQVVWKNTQYVGFGLAWNRRGNKFFGVANYYPAGNVMGQYENNVFPPS